MERYSWNDIPEEQVNPELARKVIHTPSMTILRISFKKGAIVPLHNHVHEQVTMIESGALRFELGGEEFILPHGSVLRIPPNAPHVAQALEDSVSTELFVPPREDWQR